jgi:hypothetical protein
MGGSYRSTFLALFEHHVGVYGRFLRIRVLAFMWYDMGCMDDTLLVVWLGWRCGIPGGWVCFEDFGRCRIACLACVGIDLMLAFLADY